MLEILIWLVFVVAGYFGIRGLIEGLILALVAIEGWRD